ncbi:hypothetical protein FJV76_14390 [Mesorhizobium sp. WSM4303]|uniref:hypothetical protein n=1 Tax=Mesorhizobium sp. WSM4303 TaxID=2589887 RepID=UPI00115D4A6F|nr:hypothetical protein [Mesorhizobium sp. WSM4303]TRD03820.1 hypothetical protein FJV76_14390 [Mesorhizobium sp. WSM4303]
MIQYVPGYKTRNDEIIARLRSISGASAPLDPELAIKKKAAEIAIAMALLHGGDWRVQIDHQEGFLVVARRGRSKSQ